MGTRWLMAVTLLGCHFDAGRVEIGDGGAGGADAPDAIDVDGAGGDGPSGDGPSADGLAGCVDWTTANVQACASRTPQPAGDLALAIASYRYDTGTDAWTPVPPIVPPSAQLAQTSGSGPDVRVMAVDHFNLPVGAVLEVQGSIPLVLLVHGDAAIGGDITVTAGRDAGTCDVAGGGGASGGIEGGAGGGGGGGFGAAGGAGADGNTNKGDSGGAGGSGAALRGNPELVPLRGGCPGAAGGTLDGNAGTGSRAGQGGGAVQISVRGSVVLSGQIDAPGAGGAGGAGPSGGGEGGRGGGGGGSGGAIAVEGQAITVSGRLCANGGAGGEGQRGATAGASGQAGVCENVAAVTSSATVDGGNGGDGGYRVTPGGGPGDPGTNGGAGGGGGGGVGRIRIWQRSGGTAAVAGIVTPAPEFLGP